MNDSESGDKEQAGEHLHRAAENLRDAAEEMEEAASEIGGQKRIQQGSLPAIRLAE